MQEKLCYDIHEKELMNKQHYYDLLFNTITSEKEKIRNMKQPNDKSTLASCFGPGHALPDVVRNLNGLILQVDMSKMI